MSLAIVYTRAQLGIDAPLVQAEVHLSGGLPGLSIVGLPETAVKESKDRVRSALLTTGLDFPRRRITVNLAPADLPKQGGRFDLPIAVGILAASGQADKQKTGGYEFIAELGLDGSLRKVTGPLPASLSSRNSNRTLIVAPANGEEAALVEGSRVLAAAHLLDVLGHLNGTLELPAQRRACGLRAPESAPDLLEVKGQFRARRVLEIAAAGAHNLLMVGPPGTGKTMLATRLPGILPSMSESEALETAAVRSVAGLECGAGSWGVRPFRAPHHTASAVALVGGSARPRPGEISLAHNGVLFLDELPEFDRRVLEVLREPLETARVTISRAARQAEFPARFQLVAAMNPCPCGYLGDDVRHCRCSQERIARYRARISGPLLDRIDLHIEVPAAHAADTRDASPAPSSSAQVRERVQAARDRQHARARKANAWLGPAEIGRDCATTDGDAELLRRAIRTLGLSARSRDRILRVSRTIADLEASDDIESRHLREALSYRCLDRPLESVAASVVEEPL